MKRIIFFLLLLISFEGFGQVKQKPVSYGVQYRRVQADSAMRVPTVTVGIKDAYAGLDTAQIRYDKTDSTVKVYTGFQWIDAVRSTASSPTWQQTLTAGSTLTGDNTIAGGGFDLEFVNTGSFNGEAVAGSNSGRFFTNATYSQVRAGSTTVGPFSELRVDKDTLFAMPYNGNFKIDTLPNLSTQNTLLGWKQGTGQGQVGYVTLGSGLSLSSGVLNTSGTVPTPISSLTAATGTNDINNGANTQTWRWNSLSSNTGLSIESNSTLADLSSQILFKSTLTGANVNGGQNTYAGYFSNQHTGSGSNFGVYAEAFGGTNNKAIIGASNATGGIGINGYVSGSSSYAGYFENGGGSGTGYAVYAFKTGAGTNNIGGYFSATGGTNNYAIIVPASSGSVGIGTSTPTSLLHVVPVHTTGIGAEFISSTTTSGTILDITGTSTALAANNEGLNIDISGANGTNGITATGARISVTNTNATSGTNVGLDLTASGATTANNALNIAAGAIALNGSAGTSGQVLTSAGANTLPTWSTPSAGTPAGNFGNLQIGRNSAFATPASDSLDFESATGLSVKGDVRTTTSLYLPSSSSEGLRFGTTVRMYDDGSKIRLSPSTGIMQIFTSGSNANVQMYNSAGDSYFNFAPLSGTGSIFETAGSATNLKMQNTAAHTLMIGNGTAVAKTNILSTTEQLRLMYDASNYVAHTVSSAGVYTVAPTGVSITVTKPVVLKNYTVATLPAGVQGMICYVTDALAPAYGVTLTGGGAVVTMAFYDGTNWTAH